jgi:PAS domain S-box-containing protein
MPKDSREGADLSRVGWESQTITSSISLNLEPCLEVLESNMPESVGRLFPITADGILIGRSAEAEVRLEDESLSREHARVALLPAGDMTLVDLGSTNGTYLNGVRVERANLRVGDRIRIGRTLIQCVRDSLRRSKRVSDLLISAHIALWDWDEESGRFSASHNFAEVTGIAPEELGALDRMLLLVHPDDRTALRNMVDELRAGRDQAELDVRVRGTGYYDVWLSLHAQAVRTGSGLAIAGSATNITPRKRSERELRRVTQVLENLHDAIVVTDLDGRITDWTAKAQATFQRSGGGALPARLHELVGGDRVDEIRRAISDRGHWTGEIPIILSGDAEGMFEVATAPLKDDEGWVIGYIAALRDVTAKKALQNQLILADKLAAIGSIAAGVAHEINNPLAVVTGGLDWIAERVQEFATQAAHPAQETATLREVLAEMKDGVARIAAIVAGMKNASQKDDPSSAQQVPLRGAIEGAARILANEVRHAAKLSIDIPEDLWVACSETRVMQVFIHLIANAVHAVEDRASSGNEIRIEVSQRAPDRVAVAVRDTGVGMSPETLSRLFTPFFTTKPTGKGTGLGLSVTRTILESAGGHLQFESRLGHGTTAYVQLPIVPPPAAPVAPAAVPEPSGKRGSILVIDDEPFVANALSRLLRSRGFKTEVATDGRVGLEKMLKGDYQAVLCDLMMPEFSGVDLYHQVAASAPDLVRRLIFLSGGAFTPRAEEFVQEAHRPVLSKPWKVDLVVAAIEAIE